MKGLVEEGIKANLQALSVEPKFPIAHNNLAVAYLQLEDYKQAIKHCDIAVDLGFDVNPALLDELAPHRNA
jgi:tetratricopeptide (TPR) repeat protein